MRIDSNSTKNGNKNKTDNMAEVDNMDKHNNLVEYNTVCNMDNTLDKNDNIQIADVGDNIDCDYDDIDTDVVLEHY